MSLLSVCVVRGFWEGEMRGVQLVSFATRCHYILHTGPLRYRLSPWPVWCQVLGLCSDISCFILQIHPWVCLWLFTSRLCPLLTVFSALPLSDVFISTCVFKSVFSPEFSSCVPASVPRSLCIPCVPDLFLLALWPFLLSLLFSVLVAFSLPASRPRTVQNHDLKRLNRNRNRQERRWATENLCVFNKRRFYAITILWIFKEKQYSIALLEDANFTEIIWLFKTKLN